LEKIVFNLLSNAFKYTPDGRMVKLLLHEFAGSIAIEIADQGIGIPKERRSSLFERFENHLNKKYFSHSSTGLGLSLTKELVELHGGNIKVEDIPAGGTSFTVELPKGREHFGKNTEFIVDDANEVESEEDSYIQDSAVEETDNRQTLLIVEDNKEMSCFLRQMFVGEFTVYTAANGAEGLEKSLAIQPDLIISDVMMPEMDGVEMVKRLRSDMATSHIPIILLTAKSDIDNRLKGLEVGADDYMTKPFSSSYLRARVDNLLKRHIDIYRLYSSDNGTETVGGQEDNKCITKRDQEFLDSLRLLIDKNIDNTELMIGDLATEMAMSRTVFFKKLKSLTGLAPNEFLREVRITKAARLLDTDEYSISQIADMVGICGSRYFAKCFKQKFGMTATEYKNRHRDNA
jgi:DNA-binding response OmpR family regulator